MIFLFFTYRSNVLSQKGHQHHIVDKVSTTGHCLQKTTSSKHSFLIQRVRVFRFSLLIIYSDACFHFQTQQQSQFCQSKANQCYCISECTVLNILTLLIKSYLNSVLLSLTDSKVIKLLKGVTDKTVVSRLRQERLIKWPLLLFSSSKSAFFSPRQASMWLFFMLLKMCEHTEFFCPV